MIIQQRSSVLLVLLVLSASAVVPALASLTVVDKDLTVVQGETKSFVLVLSESPSVAVEVRFDVQHSDLVRVEPTEFNISAESSLREWNITVYGLESGHSTISANVTPSDAIEGASPIEADVRSIGPNEFLEAYTPNLIDKYWEL